MKDISVFAAGVAGRLAKIAAERFRAEYPGAECHLSVGGSNAGINRLKGGENFDVMILADNEGVDQLLMPEYADGYFIWGGNEMVVMGNDVTAENWPEKLTDPSARVVHANPYDDPGGYRAVMAMKLADLVQPGLSEKLLGNPSYKGLDREQYAGGFKPAGQPEDGEYRIVYRSIAAALGANYALLPPQMSLGDPNFEETYAAQTFTVDGGAEVHGNTILHAVVIPKNAENPEGAEAFLNIFLRNRFMMQGFTPIQRKVGAWTLEPPNMWDAESRSYSLMTLMEVNGTNKQLDCIPLLPDDVVLDCGCGPGRVAIQAAKRVKKVICLDNSKGMLDECKKNCAAAGVTNVEFVLADWQETEIGTTIPEVDVVIQSRGGGGPSTFEQLQKAARRAAAFINWSDGAPCLPESRGKLFTGCYTDEDMEKYPCLRPMIRRPLSQGSGRANFPEEKGRLPMGAGGLRTALEKYGVELHVTTVDEGWDKQFDTKEDAYDWLIELSRYPELVNMDKFRENVDSYLTEKDGGWYFFLPTRSDVAWFKTR